MSPQIERQQSNSRETQTMSKTGVTDDMRAVPPAGNSPDDRMPAIAEADMTPEQRAAVDAFREKRGQEPGGPFVPLVRSPAVLEAATHLGAYLRFDSALAMDLSELAIIITARRWSQNYEWGAHRKIAEKAGLSPDVSQAIGDGRRPEGMTGEQQIVYDFCTEVHANGQVCDVTYDKAKAAFGEQGVIDLTTICGYYSLLAMVMNVARTSLPDGAETELKPFNKN
jgi:4-carboxymuconolactone decarboxylase